jgi:hypothetical protein
MHLDDLLWLFLPVFVAGGSMLITYYIMQARMEAALAQERETLAELRAIIDSHQSQMEERVRATEESSKRQALDDFMQDIRIDERSYIRESKSLDGARKTMVMQERLFFRNIPLSNWIEHEMVVEEGNGQTQLPRESVFAPASLSVAPPPQMVASLEPQSSVAVARLNEQETSLGPMVLTPHAAAFGAQ